MSARPPFPSPRNWRSLLELALAEDLGSGRRHHAARGGRGGAGPRADRGARARSSSAGSPIAAAVFARVDPTLALRERAPRTASWPSRARRSPACRGSLRAHPRRRAHRAQLPRAPVRRRDHHAALRRGGRGHRRAHRRHAQDAARAGARSTSTRRRSGGALNHRTGLFDGILLKDNHVALAGGVALAVKAARAAAPAGLRIQVEVESEADAVAAVEAGADFLLLDNCTLAALRAIVRAGRRSRAARGERRRAPRERARDRRDRRARASRSARSPTRRPPPTSRSRSTPEDPSRSGAGMKPGPARVLAALRRAEGRTLLRRLALLRARRLARADLEGRRGAARAGLRDRGGGRRRLPARRRPGSAAARRGLRRPRRRAGSRATCAGSRPPTRPTAWRSSSRATGAAHGTTVVAEAQTAGRGRLGRALLLAAAPEPLHLDRAAAARSPRPRRRPGSWPARSRSPRRSSRRVGDARRGRDQVAERRAARRAQDLGHPDGARRRGDPRRLPGARHRRQPERRPARLSRGVPRDRDEPCAATAARRSTASPSRTGCTMRSSGRSTPARNAASRRCARASRRASACAGGRSRVVELDGSRQRGVAEGVAADGALLLRARRRRARARRRGRRDAGEGERVTTLLVIDIGNTNVSLGLFDYRGREARRARAALAHRHAPRADLRRGRRSRSRALFDHAQRATSEVTDVIISSVVPPLLPIWERVCDEALRPRPR